MSILGQALNKVSYALHSLTYDPEAEKFAQAQKDAADKAVADAAAQKSAAESQAKAAQEAAKKAKADQAAAEAAKQKEERNSFDLGRLLGQIFGIISIILLVFLVLVLGVFGASLATNLNVHREWTYRLLYAIWGFLFFWVVIPYVLLYRWWWRGLRPRYYALIPLVPYHFDNYYMGALFSWLSFKPDEVIADLREWEAHNK